MACRLRHVGGIRLRNVREVSHGVVSQGDDTDSPLSWHRAVRADRDVVCVGHRHDVRRRHAAAHTGDAPGAFASIGSDSGPAEPAGPGYALQIAALRDRDEADAIAKRLESKGYAAYVLAPASGTPPVFRVRIGKFKTRRDAETVSAKLQKEEQFNLWITR